MKKIRWSTLSDPEVDNFAKITLKGSITPDLEVSIKKKNGKVTRFMDIKVDEQEVLLTPKFQWEQSEFQDVSPSSIEYAIKKADDCWRIDDGEGRVTVMPGKQAEFEAARKEMHKKLLEERLEGKIKLKQDIDKTDMKYNILPDGRGNYKVKIHLGDSSEDREFPWEKVEIEPNYYQNKGIDSENALNPKYLEEEIKSRWTTGWIVFFVVLAVVVILIIVFWKKIWKWIKGEREQEKKVKEQLDIF